MLATDMSQDSAGLFLADSAALTPSVGHEDYAGELLRLCETHEIDLVIPILDLEVPVVGSLISQLELLGTRVAVDPPTVTSVALDKGLSIAKCVEAGVQIPPTWEHLGEVPHDQYPIIGKPRMGTGARGIVKVASPSSAPTLRDDGLLWQKFVAGPEYSIDMWGSAATSLFTAVPRWRRRIRDGQMVFGETVHDDDLIAFARNVADSFGVAQVSCLQVIRGEDEQLYFVELNPRYGTGVSLSIAAGVHFPALQWYHAHRPERLAEVPRRFTAGTKMIRYWEEHYFS